MAWPGTLTEEEEQVVKVFVDQLYRPALINLVGGLNLLAGMKEEWTNRVQSLFAKVGTDDLVPNESGLAGAEALSKAEILSQLGNLQTLLTSYNTAALRATYAQAIGGVNMVREQ